MSGFIFRIVPKEEVSEIKIEKIKREFSNQGIIGEETQYWGKPAFKSGKGLGDYLGVDFEDNGNYISNLVLQINEEDYGVVMGTEDYDTITRKNCVVIFNGDGSINSWNKLYEFLEEITDNKYSGEWELL